jgi:hypothetical protein
MNYFEVEISVNLYNDDGFVDLILPPGEEISFFFTTAAAAAAFIESLPTVCPSDREELRQRAVQVRAEASKALARLRRRQRKRKSST